MGGERKPPVHPGEAGAPEFGGLPTQCTRPFCSRGEGGRQSKTEVQEKSVCCGGQRSCHSHWWEAEDLSATAPVNCGGAEKCSHGAHIGKKMPGAKISP